jgi:hypothetical protein
MLGYMGSCRILCDTHEIACRLKITFTSNPKLKILLCDMLIIVLSSFKLLSLVALTRCAALNLAYLLEVGQQAYCTISKFVYTGTTPSSRHDPQASKTGTDFPASQAQVLVLPSLCWAYYEQEMPSSFFPTICSMREAKKITTDELHTRTSFQRFLNKTPHSPFKKLIVSMPNLL